MGSRYSDVKLFLLKHVRPIHSHMKVFTLSISVANLEMIGLFTIGTLGGGGAGGGGIVS